MSTNFKCTGCGESLPETRSAGLCQQCLIRAGKVSIPHTAIYIRCPHCYHNIEIVDDAILEVTCPTCDSRVKLVEEPTLPWSINTTGTLGRFQLQDRVGIGSFGTVWKAHDPELDRTVAIKLPRKEHLTETEIQQFMREARAAGQLRHRAIVAVHEVGYDSGRIYIVSDFIQGTTLAEWLKNRSPDVRRVAELVVEIADALEVAHRSGIIHRDLKPTNIMLDSEGRPHVMDFGLAKRVSSEITMTLDGLVLGTPAYMSPEQARGEGHLADARSDVYSIGVMLFEMLTGERPFRGSSKMLLDQVIHEEAPDPRKLRNALPADIATICLKCLEKRPELRYGSAKALSDELRRFLENRPILARPVTRFQRAIRWCQRNPTTSLLVSAIFLSLVVGLATTAWQWRSAVHHREAADASRSVAEHALNESRSRLSRLYVERGLRSLEQNPFAGMPWYYEALRTEAVEPDAIDRHRLRLRLMVDSVPPCLQFWPRAKVVAISPDREVVAFAVGQDVFLHNTRTNRTSTAMHHDQVVAAVYFTPQADRILSVANSRGDRNIYTGPDVPTFAKVWNVATSQAESPSVRVDPPQFRGFPEIQFSPDGREFLSIKQTLLNRFYTRVAIDVFDTASLQPMARAFDHHYDDEYLDLRISPDKQRVLTLQGIPYRNGDRENQSFPNPGAKPQQWEIRTGAPVGSAVDRVLAEFTGDGFYSEDGKFVVVCAELKDGIDLMDAESMTVVRHWDVPEELKIGHGRLHVAGRWVFASVENHFIGWEIASGESIHFENNARKFQLSQHGKYIAWESGGRHYVRDLNLALENDVEIPEFEYIAFDETMKTATLTKFDHSERSLAVPQRIRVICDLEDGQQKTSPWRFSTLLPEQNFTNALDAGTGKLITRDDFGVWLWDLGKFDSLLHRLPGTESARVRDAESSRTGEVLVAILENSVVTNGVETDEPRKVVRQRIATWDMLSATQRPQAWELDGQWNGLSLSSRGKWFALQGNQKKVEDHADHSLQLWNTSTAKQWTGEFEFEGSIGKVLFSPDETWVLITESDDSVQPPKIRLHRVDLNGAEGQNRSRELRSNILPFAISPKERLFFARRVEDSFIGEKEQEKRPDSEDESWIWVFDAQTLERIGTMSEGHDGDASFVSSAELSADGNWLVFGRKNGRVEIWNATTRTQNSNVVGTANGSIESIEIADDGRSFTTFVPYTRYESIRPEVRRWSLPEGKAIAPPAIENTMTAERLRTARNSSLAIAVGEEQYRLWDLESGLPLSAALEFPEKLAKYRNAIRRDQCGINFSGDDKIAYLETAECVWVLDLHALRKRIGENTSLQAWSQILSGHRIDAAGAYVSMTIDEMEHAWSIVKPSSGGAPEKAN